MKQNPPLYKGILEFWHQYAASCSLFITVAFMPFAAFVTDFCSNWPLWMQLQSLPFYMRVYVINRYKYMHVDISIYMNITFLSY